MPGEQARTHHDIFATTHWSLVIEAGNESSPNALAALERLYLQYYPPIYGYVRRRGFSPTETEDLTHGFFLKLLEKNLLRAVIRERGKFRAFLLRAVQSYLADEHDRATTQKRGGGRKPLPLPTSEAEASYVRTLADGMTPEKQFEINWALVLLKKALARLEAEYESRGQTQRFTELREFLEGPGEASYAAKAKNLGISEDSVKTAVHRLRKRYSEILKEELLQTVASADDLQEEIHHLFRIFDPQ